MSEIKKLLHRYLCKDAIIVCELSEKSNDFLWLEKRGYYDRKKGVETPQGKKYTNKHNILMAKHFNKIKDRSLGYENLKNLKNELNKYIRKNPDIDIYKDLTESEIFAYKYINHGQW